MKFIDAVNKRYSMRQYLDKPVDEKLIKGAIELAKLAPSAGNLQSYKVVITKERVTNIEAPLNLIICADPEKCATRYGDRGRNLYAIQDAAIFGAYLQLALVNLGLSCAWVGAFSERRIRTITKIPEKLKPVTVIPVGYAIGEKTGRRRRKYKEIVL